MVNTGKPSGGCKLCRARRIKCDERKPFCLRCEKSKRQCPGYRDPFETKIRDETEATISKFSVPGGQQRRYPLLPSPPPDRGGPDLDLDLFVDRISRSLPIPVDRQACCHFLTDFVLLRSHPKGYGYHQFIYGLLQRDDISPAFDMAFKAVSIMGLSRRPSYRSLQLHARAFYSKALRAVNHALQDPSQVQDDQTMAAVLLMAFYESLASNKPTLDGYLNHLQGATLILKARGDQVHQTPEGHEMFQLIKTQTLVFSQMPGLAASAEDYSWLVLQDPNNPGISSAVNRMTLELSSLRNDTNRLSRAPQTPEVREELSLLLRRARGLVAKMKRPPPPPNVHISTDAAQISDSASPFTTFLGPNYVFDALYIGLIYQAACISGLLLTTSVFRIMAALYGVDRYKTAAAYQEMVSFITECIGEIISSLPYLLGWKGKDSVKAASSPCGAGDEEGPMRGGIGVMIQWSIYATLVSDFATEKQKIFLRGRLKYLTEVLCIQQANTLSMLEHNATPSTNIIDDLRARSESPASSPGPETPRSVSPPDAAAKPHQGREIAIQGLIARSP